MAFLGFGEGGRNPYWRFKLKNGFYGGDFLIAQVQKHMGFFRFCDTGFGLPGDFKAAVAINFVRGLLTKVV
jgi:hypothetical protein